ncbi:MAG: DUF3991 and TOPRIM domain-containing protein [Rhodopila sp.]|jgi:hypothetical protein
MAGHHTDLDLFRRGVNCAALLEGLSPPWRLDRKESTRRALKYRRGKGEVLIINHEGHGWWDPLSPAKGDIFDLVRFLDPSLTFAQACRVLRPFVGITPGFPDTDRPQRTSPDRSLSERWKARPRLHRGSPAWRYLAERRCLPDDVLSAAAEQDAVREGYHGSAWFAHRNGDTVSHIDVRGPAYKGALSGGRKTFFRFGGAGQGCRRLVVTEAPIDALSLAAIEDVRADTVYVATGGGMGPGTLSAIATALTGLARDRNVLLASAADANGAGDRYAARHAEIAAAAGVGFVRLRPTIGIDWNDEIKRR